MDLAGNTILITGGGSGIGLALAQEFKKLGNTVIVAGRSAAKLADASAKGLRTLNVDMTDVSSVEASAALVVAQYPALNIVIHNAGMMVNEKLTTRNNSRAAIDTIGTNLIGPIVLTNALLPHFLNQPSAVIMTVTSGLAFVPLALTPTYSATKAAIHSYTQSLRYQLKNSSVEVKELVPPYVRTSLMGERQAQHVNAMPVDEFVSEVMSILRHDPRIEEILVKRVQPQRQSSDEGTAKYAAFFSKQNEALMAARKKEWDAL